jgi:transcriptional regulator with GAF, ATPase, and Fis domain
MSFEDKEFFRNATLRICGSLEIEKALWQCLLYIKNFIPADQAYLHMYHQDSGVAETVAHASMVGCKALSIKSMLSKKGRRQVEAQRSMRTRRISKIRNDTIGKEVNKNPAILDLSAIVMDLVIERQFLGVVSLIGRKGNKFTPRHEYILTLLNEPFAIAFTNYIRYRELKKLKDFLIDNNRYLQDELRKISGEEVIGAEFGLKEVMEMVRQVAPLNSPILLFGETGVGKELFASTIHNLSPRREGPFIKVNCGAIPESLMDSELFGHEKGAFTGANTRKLGRFERANNGTIFLDEIGELSPEAQVRLLRVLQEKEIDRVGGTETIRIDIRVIAATHRNLEEMLLTGKFREDLYYRLNVFPIMIPPLRNRNSDIPAIVQHFIHKKSLDMKLRKMPQLAPGAIDRLVAYKWPGNVRELENLVERALILNKGSMLTFNELGASTSVTSQIHPNSLYDNTSDSHQSLNLDVAMARHIKNALKISNEKIDGRGGAAELMGINASTLRHRMKKLGISFKKNRLPLLFD